MKPAQYARVTLLAGFITIRDLGGSGVNVSLRSAIMASDISLLTNIQCVMKQGKVYKGE